MGDIADNSRHDHFVRVDVDAWPEFEAVLTLWDAAGEKVQEVTYDVAVVHAQRDVLGDLAMTLMYGEPPTVDQIAVLHEYEKERQA